LEEIVNEIHWLTQTAVDRLLAELAEREGERREELVKRIETAREEGDLKENAGYHAAKDEQGKNEARIKQIRHLLEHSKIGSPEVAEGVVHIGQVVTVEFADGGQETFLLGSREEASHSTVDVLSPTSPLGAAVLNKEVGDQVKYSLPNGKEVMIGIVEVKPYS
jgi:transcription elongation factor GreA